MLPTPCCLFQVIQNPSEMQSSVPAHGFISPAKGEMPQTSRRERSNSLPKDCRVLDAKPTHAAWLPNRGLEQLTSLEVALTSGLSNKIKQFSWVPTVSMFFQLLSSVPCRAQRF